MNRQSKDLPDIFVYLMFTASGASALIYQVIWARWLGLIFGNTTTSISVILASFMLGLALGSILVGRLLPRVSNPMTWYAWLELGIGLVAICFPVLTWGIEWVYVALVDEDSSRLMSFGLRTALAFLILGIPTTLMGATLPLLTDFFRREAHFSRNWKVGLLYATNTIGAAIGSLLASFFLIELIGIRSTTLVAAGFNILIALIAIRLAASARLAPYATTGSTMAISDPAKTIEPSIALLVLAATGAIAMASEVLWTRVLEVLVGNSSYAFATILVVYLTGIALGSWLVSRVVTRIRSLRLWLGLLPLAMALWTGIAIMCFNLIAEYFSQFSFQHISMMHVLGLYMIAASLLLPLSLLSGAIFPVATRILEPNDPDATGELISRAYAWNTVGAVIGSLAAGFGVAVFLDYLQSIYLLVFCYGGLALFILLSTSGIRKQPRFYLSAVCASALCLMTIPQLLKNERFSERIERRSEGKLSVIYHEPGLQGVTTVLKQEGSELGSHLLVNGTGMTVKITDTKMMAHLPLLLHPDPADTLVICFGMGTTFRSAISHGGNVTIVELVDEVVDSFPYFHTDAEEILQHERGKIIVNDGRNFLQTTRRQFDVITLDPPPPIDGRGITNLHSIEFIELARQRLKPGGIMAHWIPYPWAAAGVDDWETFSMLADSFRAVFPYSVMIPGVHSVGLHVLGSMEPIDTSMPLIEQRLTRSNVVSDLNEWQPVPDSYYQGLQPLPYSGEDAVLLTDDRPRLEFKLLRNIRQNATGKFHKVHW